MFLQLPFLCPNPFISRGHGNRVRYACVKGNISVKFKWKVLEFLFEKHSRTLHFDSTYGGPDIFPPCPKLPKLAQLPIEMDKLTKNVSVFAFSARTLEAHWKPPNRKTHNVQVHVTNDFKKKPRQVTRRYFKFRIWIMRKWRFSLLLFYKDIIQPFWLS